MVLLTEHPNQLSIETLFDEFHGRIEEKEVDWGFPLGDEEW